MILEIEKRLKSAKRTKYTFIISAIIFVISFIISMTLKSDIAFAFAIIYLYALIIAFISGLVYLIKYKVMIKSIKILEQNSIDYRKLVEDIDPFPLSCKFPGVFAGKYAFVFSGAMPIVPYKHIAWIYRQKTKVNGIPAGSCTILKTVTGQEISLNFTDEILMSFLCCFREQLPNHLIVGYSSENARQFEFLVSAYKKSVEQRKNADNNYANHN